MEALEGSGAMCTVEGRVGMGEDTVDVEGPQGRRGCMERRGGGMRTKHFQTCCSICSLHICQQLSPATFVLPSHHSHVVLRKHGSHHRLDFQGCKQKTRAHSFRGQGFGIYSADFHFLDGSTQSCLLTSGFWATAAHPLAE